MFPEKTTTFEVSVDLVADMSVINPFDFFLEPEAETWPFTYDPVLEQELAPFRLCEPAGPLLHALLADRDSWEEAVFATAEEAPISFVAAHTSANTRTALAS